MPVSSPAWLKRQPSGQPGPPPAAEAIEAFKAFVDAESFPDALKWHAELLDQLNLLSSGPRPPGPGGPRGGPPGGARALLSNR